jgi:hypothetical protein
MSKTFEMNGSVLELLRRGLENQLKHALTEQLVSSKLAECEKEIRAAVVPLVKTLLIDKINTWEDYKIARTELMVSVRINDGEPE